MSSEEFESLSSHLSLTASPTRASVPLQSSVSMRQHFVWFMELYYKQEQTEISGVYAFCIKITSVCESLSLLGRYVINQMQIPGIPIYAVS
jgi:hypothetical protein